MIKFFPDQRVVVMDLVDLEHCGFDHDEFVGELHLSGIEDEGAKFPLAFVVNVAGGHVITPDTRQETVEAAMLARKRFGKMVENILFQSGEGCGNEPQKTDVDAKAA